MSPEGRRERKAPEVRRQQILEAAAELFIERGISSTSMAQVADAAGVAKGTPYLYFASKDELLSELRTGYLQEWYSLAEELLRQDGVSQRDRLRNFLKAIYEFHSAKIELHQLLFSGEGEDDLFARASKLLTGFLEEGKANGTTENVEVTATFAIHGLHGVLVTYLHEGRPATQFVDDVMEVLDPLLK
jgi:TetR/AcrR family transcriptional regulator, transcriptional repressor for nem operon